MADDKKEITIVAQEVIQMMHETSRLVVNKNASRLSSIGVSAIESDVLTNNVEFWNWLNQNYVKSGHFASAENAMEYVSGTAHQRRWVETIVQGKGYEWDWMSDQRSAFKNIFKRYDAGTVANRSASDVTEIDALMGQSTEYQMKAYRSSNTPKLKNTPKDMAIVTNAEKVDPVKNKGYENVISYKDNNSIKQATDQRMQQIESGNKMEL
ncbi:hypothetical protein KPL47_02330 [Clostridium estertheticum]|uniref:hypothetical protein n=1 Tax=Clostridium estertheticum TaxID=238834 RepID=UPI001C0E524A|nr:hypothetical protein [Clostridium estertheticum]MBU3175199.1 hypothetical protein [Clostridium estertheticum]